MADGAKDGRHYLEDINNVFAAVGSKLDAARQQTIEELRARGERVQKKLFLKTQGGRDRHEAAERSRRRRPRVRHQQDLRRTGRSPRVLHPQGQDPGHPDDIAVAGGDYTTQAISVSPTTTPPAAQAAGWGRLQALLKATGGVVVAFSGGVDSALLLAASRVALGDRVLAVTALSETYPQEEAEGAERLAHSLGVAHRFVVSEELDLPEFTHNPRNRCYYCKKELFSKLVDVAADEGLACVVDGSNLDDQNDHRPGSQAASELAVRSPLREAGLTKPDIRALSRWLELPTWDKPSFACLSSRFPYGTAITRERVGRVGKAESELRRLGFTQLRLRYHGEVGRLEVLPDQFGLLLEPDTAERVVAIVKEAGFTYVTFDLQGYRTGSMNEAPDVEVPTSFGVAAEAGA